MSIFKSILLIAGLLLAMTTAIFAQDFQWVQSSGEYTHAGQMYTNGVSVNTDAQGNVYAVGLFGDSLSFGPYKIEAGSVTNSYIVKYSSSGEVQWAHGFGSAHAYYGDVIKKQSAVTDAAGNSYIVLSFAGKGNVGGIEYEPGGYIIKYNTNGGVDWVKKSDLVTGWSIMTLDSQGNLLITGYRYSGGWNTIISKFSKDGDFISFITENLGADAPQAITADASGNVYVTGYSASIVGNIGGTEIAVGNYYLAKFNSAGSLQWAKTGSGAETEMGIAVQADAAENVYITGTQKDIIGSVTEATYDGLTVSDANNFLLKYDSGGNIQWAKGFTAFNVKDLATDTNGNNYVTGWFQLKAYFDADSVWEDDPGLGTTFIVNYDADGNLGWLRGIYGYHNQESSSITLDKSNSLLLTGRYLLGGIFGQDTLHQESPYGALSFAFVTKLSTEYTGIEPALFNTPSEIYLHQNYPNPFNPSTAISYQLSAVSQMQLTVYNALGQTVRTLANGRQEAGMHTVTFNASGLASGVYYYTLKTGNSAVTRKMILIR